MGGYHSVRSLTVLVIISSECNIVSSVLLYLTLFFWTIILSFWFLPFLSLKVKKKSLINHILIYFFRRAKNSLHFSTNAHNLCVLIVYPFALVMVLTFHLRVLVTPSLSSNFSYIHMVGQFGLATGHWRPLLTTGIKDDVVIWYRWYTSH